MMRTLVTLRPPEGEAVTLIEEGGRWAEPEGRVDRELPTGGWWALPGLADAHSHLAADQLVLQPGDPAGVRRRAAAQLEAGVFLCFDKGWSDTSVLTLVEEPHHLRPELQAAGIMIASPGGYYPDFALEVEEAELEEVVEAAAVESLGWVKLVGDWPRKGQGAILNFSEDALARAVEAAHRHGARVAVHTMAPDGASPAVRAGVDSIEHGPFLTEDDLRLLAARGGVWVPTLLQVEATCHALGEGSTGRRVLEEGLRRVRELLPVAADLGVRVLAGTDLAVPHGKVALEAVALAEAGLPPPQVLAAASTAARAYAGLPTGFAPGQPADAVFFASNPLQDPAVLAAPTLVMRHGRVLAQVA